MLLRHIQLIFSSQVKTFKTGKCFVEHNKFSDKLACWYLGSDVPEPRFTTEFREYPVKPANCHRFFPAPREVLRFRMAVFPL